MPKFKIEYNFNRVEHVLKKLGVRDMFIPNVGDFGDLFAELGDPSSCVSISG